MRLLSLSVAIAVLVLLACGVGVANIVVSREQIHAESARELTMVSRVVASHLGQVLDNARLALLSVRDDPGLQSDQPLHPSAELDRLLQTVQGAAALSTFVLSNPDGDIIAASSSDPTFRRVRLADRDYFRYHLPRRDQQFYVGLPVISRATGKRIIPVSIAIRDREGNLRAVLSASILSNYLERYYAELAGAHRYAISVMQREDGLLLARYPQPHAASDNPLGRYPLPASMIEGGVSYQRSPYDGTERQVVTQPLTMLPWVVAVSVDESELTEAWLLSVWRTGSLTLAFCLVAVALGWVIRRQMLALSRQAAHMQYDANHDSVTGLANRRALLAAIDTQVRHEPEWMALVLIDLDFFKRINDSWGHEAGDELLRETGRRLQAVADASHQVYRLGGDEFVVLVRGGPLAGAELARQTQTLLARLGEPYELQHGTVMLSASAGISCFPEHADHAGDLLRLADAAMYHAKRQGRNGHVFFDRSMAQEADETLLVDTALRQAIPRHELRLLYQPVVDANNGHLGKVEALLRWKHPEYGAISPARFIPVAEESGYIAVLGDWVLGEACRQARIWLDAGCPCRVAVNLSAREILEPNFIKRLQGHLLASGLPPQWLELELTERALYDGNGAAERLADLRDLGVSLAIDDFGTGYSSLSYLCRYPVQVLKIDRSFVCQLDDPANLAIVRSIIALGHSLALEIVAEGVETLLQANQLRALGCTSLQGFFFARPQTATELVRWRKPVTA
ncbi:EAL domain-containing protein [Laribacter hongkongensis]|uniref:putative bifunctional diguanylate cyclase/phosphodiesterase n=1 Tax=Laribacter hongkongensis TaxID=168471 RepID=UPI001EFCE90B|nr:EAL domain-containing protein [Laribacter hongkongensis]MCG9059590.1 EAL domain-containing protein [Laribacter hongkongensis]